MRKAIPVLAGLFGAGLVSNGIFMLASPEAWYFAVSGVTTTGPFNQHFLRDIGLIFVLIGSGFAYGTVRPGSRVMLWSMGAIWLSGHALFHVWEVAVGICGPEVLPRDFPAVTLPALIAAALSVWSFRHAVH
ncbi:hypothetical protein [Methylobacterium soli]|uniref:Uncharacterized protein n=1 Tax=Methylobacterium soli TaxID=553447 RepID=A0A6L3SQ86_9HYPH|nr:hypothetical protein [Methylobacterium soli]KAB1072913.1 hypothetical protein F6X53_27460 [Methylobacterium soli]GJE45798.1 hypothetical protein AEGHOMDF_4998 [Methylobacterium soli]